MLKDIKNLLLNVAKYMRERVYKTEQKIIILMTFSIIIVFAIFLLILEIC